SYPGLKKPHLFPQMLCITSSQGVSPSCEEGCAALAGIGRGQKPQFLPFWSTILFCGAGLAEGQGILSPLGNTWDV
ncbi:unnamed protein product, partial [Bubo scandiacus]